MRAKLNNQKARAKRERAPCPMAGKVFPSVSEHCDQCGDELVRVAAVLVEDGHKETLH